MPKFVTNKQLNVVVPYTSRWQFSGGSSPGTVTLWDSKGNRLIASPNNSGTFDSDWRIKVKKHLDATGAYTALKYPQIFARRNTAALKSSYWNSTWQKWDVFYDDFLESDLSGTSLLAAEVTDSDLRDRALKRFKSKLSDRLGNAEALIPTIELRELRSTIGAMADVTTKSLEYISSLTRSLRGAKLVTELQKAWLTWSFGIKPTVNDFQSALDSVANYFDRPKSLHRISASAKRDWFTGRKSTASASHSWNIAYASHCQHTLRYRFVGGIDFSPITGNNYGIAEHLGFSDFWDQLPAIGWELFPFSWVLDYFSTVGDYLGDTFELPPGSTRYLVETVSYRGILNEYAGITATPDVGSPHEVIFQRCIPGFVLCTRVERKALSALPHRALRIKTVDEIGKSAVNKLLNLCSVVSVEARRGVRGL